MYIQTTADGQVLIGDITHKDVVILVFSDGEIWPTTWWLIECVKGYSECETIENSFCLLF